MRHRSRRVKITLQSMRREAEYFGDAELDLVYMAQTLRKALALEDLLTKAGLEYLVETGTYTAGLLMKRELTGAFFYVSPDDTSRAHVLLLDHKYKPYLP